MKTQVGVIFGGRSGEHEISIRSARTVIEQIDHEKYNAVPIAITEAGKWLRAAESLTFFPDETRAKYFEKFGEVDPKAGGLAFVTDTISHKTKRRKRGHPLSVAFPVLHGTFGEDGTIQGLFEMADMPYVGCGVLASSTGMDKAFMKTLFLDAELPVCNYTWFLRDDWSANAEATLALVQSKIGFPCFVKPANLGSSVGVSKATDKKTLRAAIKLAARYDRKIIVEEALTMREIECAVIGNGTPQASLPGEYIIRDSSKTFLDYTEKYTGTGNNKFVVPALLSEELSDKIRQMAVTAFKAIDGSGLARVDFFLLKDNGALLVNEINTIPGLTDASGFPKMWEGSGKPFTQVIDELIGLAIERYEDKKKNRTTK